MKTIKNYVNTNSHNILAFVTLLFTVTFMLSFDNYSLTQITTETPLLNIAGTHYLRMDFILLLFGGSFLAGALIEMLLKKHSKILTTISTCMLAIISLFVAILTVDLFQKLFPTMRISHVIMTLSRLLAILVGLSGVFVGINTSALCRVKVSTKSLVYAVITSLILAVFGAAQVIQTAIYYAISILLFLASLSRDYMKCSMQECDNQLAQNFNIYVRGASGLTSFSLMFLFGIMNNMLCVSAGFSHIGYIILASLMIALFVIILSKTFTPIEGGAGLLLGAGISYVFVHYVSAIDKYSNNRIVYTLPSWVWTFYIILAVACVGLAWYALFKSSDKSAISDSK